MAMDLCLSDSRVIFLDLPKGPNHGEVHRDRAVAESRSEAVFYLCDDDLLLPKHVENLLSLLPEADLVQSRNGYLDTSGRLILFPTDLSDPEAIEWHLRSPRRNATSLTGTAHRRSTYRELPEGWVTTPPDEWPDHYMWKKFFRMDGFRGATHSEMTALQLPTSSGREDVGQDGRVSELSWWATRLAEPGAHEWIQSMADLAAAAQLAVCSRLVVDLGHELMQLSDELLEVQSGLARSRQEVQALTGDLELTRSKIGECREDLSALAVQKQQLEAVLAGVLDSRSWRITGPLRRLAESSRREATQGPQG